MNEYRIRAAAGLFMVVSVVAGCGDENTASNVVAPGQEAVAKTVVLEAGTALLQGKQPLNALDVYLDGFHF